jgi:hypothetical protein
MRKLVLAVSLIVLASQPARADGLGIGIFVGEPLGLDLKVDLSRRGALDVVIGATTIKDGRESYGHLTYLYQLALARGSSVLVPLRLGFGGYVAGLTDDVTSLGARVPFELGIRFRRSPLEIYGEITFVLQLYTNAPGADAVDTDIDGGVGLRVYF